MPQKKVSVDLSGRDFFIREFVRQLIINSKPKSPLNQETIDRIRKRVAEEIPIEISPVSTRTFSPASRNKPLQRFNPLQRRVPIRFSQQYPFRQSIPQKMQLNKSRTLPPVAQKPVEVVMRSLTKIQPFLKDPSVISIECPGNGKNLVLNRSGITHSVQFVLSENEILSILKEFSERTKVPLIPGMFKALYNNLLITAVISDVTDKRFIIEKHLSVPTLPTQEKK